MADAAVFNQSLEYVFKPVASDVKMALTVTLATVALLGGLGNSLVVWFIRTKKYTRAHQSQGNFHYFVQSLAVSDVLSCAVAAPLACLQLNLDVFSSTWACRGVRYANLVFPVITIFNLVIISLERYLRICFPNRRPLSTRLMKNFVKGAWLLGAVYTAVYVYTVDVKEVNVRGGQYTFICRYDRSTLVNRLISRAFSILVVPLPLVFLLYTSCAVVRTVRRATSSTAGNKHSFKRNRKATVRLLTIMLAFVLCYFPILCYFEYRKFSGRTLDYQVDLCLSTAAGIFLFLNGPVNVIIHLIQLPGFRSFMKSRFSGEKARENLDPGLELRTVRPLNDGPIRCTRDTALSNHECQADRVIQLRATVISGHEYQANGVVQS